MKLKIKEPGFNIKSLLILIIGGVLALYFMGVLLPGASLSLQAANFSGTNSVAAAIVVLVIPTFIAVILLKLFGYI